MTKSYSFITSRNTTFIYLKCQFFHISGPGAQAGRQQQAVLCGGGAAVTRCGWHQDAGTDGAEGLTVELRPQAQIWSGR